jgi:hypothetical protein
LHRILLVIIEDLVSERRKKTEGKKKGSAHTHVR